MHSDSLKHLVFVTIVMFTSSVFAGDNAAAGSQEPAKLFASVGTAEITDAEYNQALHQASRKRFYHGKPPEGAMEELRLEVAREVITRRLLLQEAKRLGLQADETAIKANIAQFDERYADSPRWQQQRETLIDSLSQHYREADLLQQLESRQRAVAPPENDVLRAFYDGNRDKFTEPAQHRLSLILLRVAPSSARQVWDAAMEEGKLIVKRLADGVDFAEQAKLHSADASAQQGGDMGYLHAGMLSASAEKVIAGLKPGEVSAPVRLLEGIAIFRLEDRKAAQLRTFGEVRERARELWIREQGELAWNRLKTDLWQNTPISIHNASLTLEALE